MANDHKAELRKADILCIREQYDRAIDIYNQILDEDMECEEAYVGLLKAHSEYFTIFSGEQIEKDIRIIERIFPDIENEEYLTFLKKRKEARGSQRVASTKVEERKETPFKSFDYGIEEPEPSYDATEFNARVFDFRNNKDKYTYQEYRDYFIEVMKDESVPMEIRVKAAECYGDACYYDSRAGLQFLAKYGYEFVIEHIKSDKSNNGMVFSTMGLMYFYGVGTSIDKQKAKEYWLRGRNEYNESTCKQYLKKHFGI